MNTLKRNIAIVCGGDSSEHDVSIRSAQGLYSFFDKERYNIYIVDVKGQDWHVNLPNGNASTEGTAIMNAYWQLMIDEEVRQDRSEALLGWVMRQSCA